MKDNRTSTAAELDAAAYGVALEHFPEFSAKVGVLISCFALVESYVHLLIGKLTGCAFAARCPQAGPDCAQRPGSIRAPMIISSVSAFDYRFHQSRVGCRWSFSSPLFE